MEQKILLEDESSDKEYFTIIPNIVLNHSTANDQAVYLQLKRLTKESKKDYCFPSLNYLQSQLKIGKKAIKKSLGYLTEKNWIEDLGKRPMMTAGGRQSIQCYKINNIWSLNMKYYKGGVERDPLPKKDKGGSKEPRGGSKDTKGVLKVSKGGSVVVAEEERKEERKEELSLKKIDKLNLSGYYISGFIDGEGSFYLGKNQNNFLIARLTIKLREDDLSILKAIKDYFGVGSIYDVPKERQKSLQISGIENMKKIIIPFFDKYPLQAKKKKDFELFKEVILNPNKYEENKPKMNTFNFKVDTEKPVPSYGNEDINYLFNRFKELTGLKKMDGSQKQNRRYCWLCLKKWGDKEKVEKLIKIALKDKFHQVNLTSFKYLYYNSIKILNQLKVELENPRFIDLTKLKK